MDAQIRGAGSAPRPTTTERNLGPHLEPVEPTRPGNGRDGHPWVIHGASAESSQCNWAQDVCDWNLGTDQVGPEIEPVNSLKVPSVNTSGAS